jgi:hypothetical protein
MTAEYKRDLAPAKDILDAKDLSYKKVDLDKLLESYSAKISSVFASESSISNYLDAGNLNPSMTEAIYSWKSGQLKIRVGKTGKDGAWKIILFQ